MSDIPVYFLLVDDLEGNLLSLEALLKRDGLILLKAKSGREALELLLKYDVALAFIDVQMPGMDGFELAELMRGTAHTRRVPIIFVTAGGMDWQRRFRGYEAGAVDFLQKPIEADILRSKASVFFELYRQQRQLEIQRDELKAYANALQENDRRKDEFLATLAHELRNPLAPIQNGLTISRMSPNGTIPDAVRDMLERQLAHMVRLIDDLLDVSRVNEGKINLHKTRVTLQNVVQTAAEASQPLIEAGKHSLKIDIPHEPIWLDADLTRIAQVVNNVLNNAAKYTPEGGKIELTARKKNNTVEIDVSDNGIGIPAEMLPKVFDLFTQVDRKLERLQGGLGIGLALVKRLVEMHNGTIEAKSPGPGKGSTFLISLPLATQDIEPATVEEDKNTDVTANPLRILVVDDNVDSAKTTGWMLELIGHEPSLRHNGFEVVEAATALRPDVIMLDIGLPGMNGFEVCRALRQDPLFKDTLIIAQTGLGQASDRQKTSEAGFNYHLVKPVKIEEITNLLTSIQAKQPAR